MPQKQHIETKGLLDSLTPDDTSIFPCIEASSILYRSFKVREYFKSVRIHDTIYSPDDIRDSMIIYCSFEHKFTVKIIDELKFYKKDTEVLQSDCWDRSRVDVQSVPTTWSEYYEVGSYTQTRLNAIELTTIHNGEWRRFGYYLPRTKTFVLNDLTHTIEGVMFLAKVLDCFVDWGYLTPLKKEPKEKPKIKLQFGIDAELEILNSEKRAVNLRRENLTEYYPCIRNSLDAEIGVDGAGAQCELRPKPGDSPRDVVNNLRGLFDTLSQHNIHASTKGDFYPLGAHLHIGVGKSYAPPRQLINLLDYFLGRFFLRFSGRSRSHYRRLSAVSTQPHGFEYRSLPSAWINDPKIVYIVVKIAKNIVQRCIDEKPFTLTHSRAVKEDFRKYAKLTKNQVEYLYKFAREYSSLSYEDNVVAFWKK